MIVIVFVVAMIVIVGMSVVMIVVVRMVVIVTMVVVMLVFAVVFGEEERRFGSAVNVEQWNAGFAGQFGAGFEFR